MISYLVEFMPLIYFFYIILSLRISYACIQNTKFILSAFLMMCTCPFFINCKKKQYFRKTFLSAISNLHHHIDISLNYKICHNIHHPQHFYSNNILNITVGNLVLRRFDKQDFQKSTTPLRSF